MTRLQFLPTNSAWAFTFGDALLRIKDGVDAPMFFESRDAAISEAARHGFVVNADGTVVVSNWKQHAAVLKV